MKMQVQDAIDEVVLYYLPRLNQGSARHTQVVLATLVSLCHGFTPTRYQVAASIRRCGFIRAKLPGGGRPEYVSHVPPACPTEPTQ